MTEKGASQSRRQLLVGVAGAVGVAAAASATRITDVSAAQGSPVILGQDNTGATGRTGIFVSGNAEGATLADANVSGKGNVGVYGYGPDAGVYGEGTSSGTGVGVMGFGATASPGIVGTGGDSSDGVVGYGGSGGSGVIGNSGGSGGRGVYGTANGGSDIGVLASGLAPATALQVQGKAVFSSSGAVNIASPAKSATVTNVALTTSSLVLATVQNNAGSSVAYAVPNVSGHSFTLVLNKAPATGKTAKVAWFVVN